MLAHIAGIPVEEAALSFAPIAAATGGIVGLKLHERGLRRRRATATARWRPWARVARRPG